MANTPAPVPPPVVPLRLSKFTIANFRGFDNEFSIEFDRSNFIIGANGSGKTSVLLALQLFSYYVNQREPVIVTAATTTTTTDGDEKKKDSSAADGDEKKGQVATRVKWVEIGPLLCGVSNVIDLFPYQQTDKEITLTGHYSSIKDMTTYVGTITMQLKYDADQYDADVMDVKTQDDQPVLVTITRSGEQVISKNTFIRAANATATDLSTAERLRVPPRAANNLSLWTKLPNARVMWRDWAPLKIEPNGDGDGDGNSETKAPAKATPAPSDPIKLFVLDAWKRLFPTKSIHRDKAGDLVFTRHDGKGTSITDNYSSYDLESDGVKQMVQMLGMIGHHLRDNGTPPHVSMLYLDEPTLHLHPGMIRALLHVFDLLHRDFRVQVILTSHSSDLVMHMLHKPDPLMRIITTDAGTPMNISVAEFQKTLEKINQFFDPPLTPHDLAAVTASRHITIGSIETDFVSSTSMAYCVKRVDLSVEEYAVLINGLAAMVFAQTLNYDSDKPTVMKVTLIMERRCRPVAVLQLDELALNDMVNKRPFLREHYDTISYGNWMSQYGKPYTNAYVDMLIIWPQRSQITNYFLNANGLRTMYQIDIDDDKIAALCEQRAKKDKASYIQSMVSYVDDPKYVARAKLYDVAKISLDDISSKLVAALPQLDTCPAEWVNAAAVIADCRALLAQEQQAAEALRSMKPITRLLADNAFQLGAVTRVPDIAQSSTPPAASPLPALLYSPDMFPILIKCLPVRTALTDTKSIGYVRINDEVKAMTDQTTSFDSEKEYSATKRALGPALPIYWGTLQSDRQAAAAKANLQQAWIDYKLTSSLAPPVARLMEVVRTNNPWLYTNSSRDIDNTAEGDWNHYARSVASKASAYARLAYVTKFAVFWAALGCTGERLQAAIDRAYYLRTGHDQHPDDFELPTDTDITKTTESVFDIVQDYPEFVEAPSGATTDKPAASEPEDSKDEDDGGLAQAMQTLTNLFPIVNDDASFLYLLSWPHTVSQCLGYTGIDWRTHVLSKINLDQSR